MYLCDFVLLENFCNFSCKYCSPGWKKMTLRNGDYYKADSHDTPPVKWKSVEEFYQTFRRIFQIINNHFHPHAFKISGGEIFIMPGILDFIKYMADNCIDLKILTNGSNVFDSVLQSILEYPNIHFQVSLDGHTLDMNSLRFKNESRLLSIVHLLKSLNDSMNTVEINCVLTRHNLTNFFNFADYMAELLPNCIIMPFPVRGFTEFLPTREQVDQAKTTYLEEYRDSPVLPPEGYMSRLFDILQTSRRRNKCYVPLFLISAYGDGSIQFCTCGSDFPSGNVFEQSCAEIYKQSENLFQEFSRGHRVFEACADCFTHYDLLNCYIESEVTEHELREFSVFNNDTFIRNISSFKKSER
jgi:MoaA/NifB/PqqE/SkfB family radical SAM enzyme